MFKDLRLYLFIYTSWLWSSVTSKRTENRSDEYQLYKHLFSSYNNNVRPVRFHQEELRVSFDFALYSILQLNTHDQTLSTNAEMILKWNDSHLLWEPEDYNGMEVIHVPYNRIWYPDIVLYNTASNDYKRSILTTNAIIRHTGEVELTSHVMFLSACDVDISYYPFDQQECKMHFASWTYDITKIRLINNQADLSEFSPNPEFFLENFYAEVRQEHDPCCEHPFSAVVYHIQLQRRPLHPIFFYILPGSIVNLCAIFAFLLPANCGEKIGLAMSCLVAMMVFLMAVTMDIPPSSVVPLIGRYYLSCIILLGVNVILCVISAKCRYDINTVPERLRCVTQIIGRLCFITQQPQVTIDSKEEVHTAWQATHEHAPEIPTVDSDGQRKGTYYESRTVVVLERIRSILQRRFQQERSASETTSESLVFCLVLDRCFFILLIIATVILNLEFILASPHSRTFEYCPHGHKACPDDFDYDRYEQMIESGRGANGLKFLS